MYLYRTTNWEEAGSGKSKMAAYTHEMRISQNVITDLGEISNRTTLMTLQADCRLPICMFSGWAIPIGHDVSIPYD